MKYWIMTQIYQNYCANLKCFIRCKHSNAKVYNFLSMNQILIAFT